MLVSPRTGTDRAKSEHTSRRMQDWRSIWRKTLKKACMVIVSTDEMSPFMQFLKDGDDTLKEMAAAALWGFASYNDNIKVSIVEAGGITPLVA